MNCDRENHRSRFARAAAFIVSMIVLTAASARLRADVGMCGGASITIPFTDVPSSNIFFCSIAAAYFSGLANGTTTTTYTPGQAVPREQMAAFVSRTLNQSLRRRNRRAALNQWWTPTLFPEHAKTPVVTGSEMVAYDGADLWVANFSSETVTRVRASDALVLQTWTGANDAHGVLVAQGAIYITGRSNPGRLYKILPTTGGGSPPVTLVTDQLGATPEGIAFDGAAVWTANIGGSVSKVLNEAVTTVSIGFSSPAGILYDGSNIWVADQGDSKLKKLNSDATIALSVPVGTAPQQPVFDGTNIWVPNIGVDSNSVTVVRVKDAGGKPLAAPFVLATLTGNGLSGPLTAAFDGERILVANTYGDSVSLWRAADLTPLGSVLIGSGSFIHGACSDGVNFWITLAGPNKLLRF